MNKERISQNYRMAFHRLKAEIGKVIVGQEEMIELLLAGVLSDGHILIEGVPGVAKTLTAKVAQQDHFRWIFAYSVHTRSDAE